MKNILTTLLLVCITTSAISQEYQFEIGSRTGCTGRGICTIESAPPSDTKTAVNNNNASIIQTKEGSTILRVYRDQLTAEESNRILGTPITTKNKNSLQFTMLEALPLPEEVIAATSKTKSKQLIVLEAKSYPTVISDKYIDITIVASDANPTSKE